MKKNAGIIIRNTSRDLEKTIKNLVQSKSYFDSA